MEQSDSSDVLRKNFKYRELLLFKVGEKHFVLHRGRGIKALEAEHPHMITFHIFLFDDKKQLD